ncbi:hypothetical protein JCM17845_00140 [Iodidimonas gelatinilytica]|uniref:Uncharacterized protein n=1 Tax=Iodidimonas gelatinilytica TaxID=1236966 RepID=A0A5A7MTY2_9PROT|nr:hypothetical protein [Iodidimonas gelatinilytica]GEQ99390.1 hypothetical protein JCM17845_00140 [Iodidimonas gelatinilytica]
MWPTRRGQNTHYELHGQTGARWTVLDVFDDQKEAAAEAEKVFRSGNYRAVRVLRERFDRDSSEFNSLEVLFFGRKSKPSKYDDDELAVFCRKPADLYSSESRRVIARLLAPVLESWNSTPVELLHDPDLYNRLQGAGSNLLSAVQRLAIAQVRHTGEPVTERMRGNFALIDKAAAELRQVHAIGLPVIGDLRFVDVIETLAEAKNRSFLLACVLAVDLRQYPDGVAKVERLISLIRLDHPLWVLKSLDLFLSEQLTHRRLLRHLIPDEDLVTLLEHVAALSRGMLGDAASSTAVSMLDAFLRARLLPATRHVLVGHIRHELTVSQRLTGDDLQKEFAALARLGSGIGDLLDVDLPDRPLVDLLEGRMRRLLNPQTLGEYIVEGRNPADKLQRLIALEQHCLGDANRRLIANYMSPLIHDGANEAFWLEPLGAGYAGRMKLLARLQKRLLASNMQALHKSKLTGQLDRLCVRLMADSGVLNRVAHSQGAPFDKACRLLRMIVDGHFTEGEAHQLAEADIRRYMADPDFLAPILSKAKGPQRDEAIGRLKTLLSKAGLAAADAF